MAKRIEIIALNEDSVASCEAGAREFLELIELARDLPDRWLALDAGRFMAILLEKLGDAGIDGIDGIGGDSGICFRAIPTENFSTITRRSEDAKSASKKCKERTRGLKRKIFRAAAYKR